MDFLIYPWGWIDDKRMALRRTLPQVGMYIPVLRKVQIQYISPRGSLRLHCIRTQGSERPFLLIINPLQGMYQEIHPYRAMKIDSV